MILFTGVAGSGKSLQGRMLADERAYPWLSTGEFLRMLVAGEKRKAMLAGHLLPDDEIIAVVEKVFTLIDLDKEFILDGFPRTARQAEWLYGFAQNSTAHISLVVHMVADKSVVRQRLLSRGRPDDHESAIDERFDEYEQSIKPILDYFSGRGVAVADVDASKSIDQVHAEITSITDRYVGAHN